MAALGNVRRKHANLKRIRDRHPDFFAAVRADVAISLASRGELPLFSRRSDLVLETARLMWSSDAFLALVLYRARSALQRRGIPFLPRLLHHASIVVGQICIGDPVLVHPGVYVPHGQIVVDGFTEVGSGSRLLPWTTLGLKSGNLFGPTLGENVLVGTGARVLGPVNVGNGAQIGANAVVVADVPGGQVVVGVPARELSTGADRERPGPGNDRTGQENEEVDQR